MPNLRPRGWFIWAAILSLFLDQVTKVLRAMPKHELKLVPKQSIYSASVREAARRLLVGTR